MDVAHISSCLMGFPQCFLLPFSVFVLAFPREGLFCIFSFLIKPPTHFTLVLMAGGGLMSWKRRHREWSPIRHGLRAGWLTADADIYSLVDWDAVSLSQDLAKVWLVGNAAHGFSMTLDSCFCMTQARRMVFTFLNGWNDTKWTVFWDT